MNVIYEQVLSSQKPNKPGKRLRAIEWVDNHVRIIDFSALPDKIRYLDIKSIKEMFNAIKSMSLHETPLISIAIAYGMYLGAEEFPEDRTKEDFLAFVEKNARHLSSACGPTRNISGVLDRLLSLAKDPAPDKNICKIKDALLAEANRILLENMIASKRIGEIGYQVLRKYSSILVYCNTGDFTGADFRSALSPIYFAAEQGQQLHVYINEVHTTTQGSRLAALELAHAGISVTVINDSATASLMASGAIDAVLVSADRVASNGDAASNIGTYGLAVLARYHRIPFYVVAPFSAFDLTLESGKDIFIERESRLICYQIEPNVPPINIPFFEAEFDITPHECIDGIITEEGILEQPFAEIRQNALA
jgi:methylthioribose-1-phosphate isomerase